jgi:hypothetical protein
MRNAERFAYTAADVSRGEASLLPILPIQLHHGQGALAATGLLDTGATVNVLPYPIGEQLGADWEEQTVPLRLSGNLARLEARALVVSTTIGGFPPVRLAFAWTLAEDVPLILGQVNFFMEFDVCFYRSRHLFEVRPRRG